MPRIVEVTVTVTTTGSAGSATGNTDSPALNGILLDIYLDYHASAPSTTDVTVSYKDPVKGNLTVVTDNKTDKLVAPMQNAVDVAGAAIAGVYTNYPLNGTLNVAVAGCDALTGALVATIRYESR